MKIGLDVLGGDFAPDVNVSGALQAREELGDRASIVLIGDESDIIRLLDENGAPRDTFDIIHTSEGIAMNDHPAKAF